MAPPTRAQGAAAGTTPRAKKRQPLIVTAYLVLYNLVSLAGWGYILVTLLAHLAGVDLPRARGAPPPNAAVSALASARDAAERLLALLVRYVPALAAYVPLQTRVRARVPGELDPLWARAASAYAAVGAQTKFVQTGALLEVVHALLGLVRSPLFTTVMQVSSRLQLVWGIADRFPTTQTNPLYASMVIAWSVTEVIRYAFYALSLLGLEPYPLLWLRYTTFWILYPIGAGSEAFLMYATLPSSSPLSGTWTPYELHRGALFIIWWPALFFLYTHMIKQRRKIIGGNKLAKQKTQ